MENVTVSEKYKEFIVPSGEREKVLQTIYKFPNEYGASVVFGDVTYGLEVAVLDFNGKESGRITYETEVANDVMGYVDDLDELLEEIKGIEVEEY